MQTLPTLRKSIKALRVEGVACSSMSKSCVVVGENVDRIVRLRWLPCVHPETLFAVLCFFVLH